MRAKRNIYQNGGRFRGRLYGQEASEVRKDADGRTFVWYAGDADGLPLRATDQEWKDRGGVKVYGDFSKYVGSKFRDGIQVLTDDHDLAIRPTGEEGVFELDDRATQGLIGQTEGFEMAEEVQYDDRGTAKDLLARLNAVNKPLRGRMEGDQTQYLPNPGRAEREMAGEARGGMGASATEDLLERLMQFKRNAYGNKYEQGGMVAKKKGSTIKIAGQYAVDSIKTTPQGNQYVSMELPNGEVVPVFGDWETYGNPDRERRIADLDFRIYPLGDGTYALDAAEAEAEMLRDEARGVAKEAVGGMGASPTEDLLEKLNQRRSMGERPRRRG